MKKSSSGKNLIQYFKIGVISGTVLSLLNSLVTFIFPYSISVASKDVASGNYMLGFFLFRYLLLPVGLVVNFFVIFSFIKKLHKDKRMQLMISNIFSSIIAFFIAQFILFKLVFLLS